MRSFKVRVWNGEEMLDSDEIGGFAIDDLSNGLWLETMLSLDYNDKNDRVVFQDDILKIHRFNISSGNHYNEYCVAPVIIYSDFITQVVDIEIIGNIHQNPQLLDVR